MALLGWGLGGLAVHLLKRTWPPFAREGGASSRCSTASRFPACLWMLVEYPFELQASAAVFHHAARAVLPRRHRAVDDLRSEPRGCRLAVLRGSPRRVARRGVGDGVLLQLLGGEASLLLAAVAPMVASALLSRRFRLSRRSRAPPCWPSLALSRTAGPACFTSSPAPSRRCAARWTRTRARASRRPAGTRTRASTPSRACSPKFLARLYIDSDAWTSIMPWDGQLDSVHELRDSYRALPFQFNPGGETLVIGPGGGPDVVAALASGSQQGHGGRNESADDSVRASLRRAGRQPLRSARRRGDPERGPQLHQPHRSKVRHDLPRLRRLVGVGGLGRAVAVGELSLHDAGVPRVLRSPQRQRRARDPAVGLGHPAARLELGRAARRRRPHRSGSWRCCERRGTATDPPQMLFMLRKRPFTPAESAAARATGPRRVR